MRTSTFFLFFVSNIFLGRGLYNEKKQNRKLKGEIEMYIDIFSEPIKAVQEDKELYVIKYSLECIESRFQIDNNDGRKWQQP